MMPRYVPDVGGLLIDKTIANGNFDTLVSEKRKMRARFRLACAEIGEPPLHDQMKDVPIWASIRTIEQSVGRYGIGAHRSEVSIVRNHQELWGTTTQEALITQMSTLLSGVRGRLNDYEEQWLMQKGVLLEQVANI